MKRLLTNILLMPLFYGYFVGVIVSGVYLNWKYAQNNGFIKWLFLGEIVPTLQSTIWPYYAIQHFSASAPTQRLTESTKQQLAQFSVWWLPEYPSLLKAVDSSPNKEMRTSYKTGPKGTHKVHLTISKTGTSFLLKMDLPANSIVTYDKKTGKRIASEIRPVIVIRDNNLDGKPDDFMMKPDQTAADTTIPSDGFMKLQDTDEYKAILIQWAAGIGFSINYFLHGISSVNPR